MSPWSDQSGSLLLEALVALSIVAVLAAGFASSAHSNFKVLEILRSRHRAFHALDWTPQSLQGRCSATQGLEGLPLLRCRNSAGDRERDLLIIGG